MNLQQHICICVTVDYVSQVFNESEQTLVQTEWMLDTYTVYGYIWTHQFNVSAGSMTVTNHSTFPCLDFFPCLGLLIYKSSIYIIKVFIKIESVY